MQIALARIDGASAVVAAPSPPVEDLDNAELVAVQAAKWRDIGAEVGAMTVGQLFASAADLGDDSWLDDLYAAAKQVVEPLNIESLLAPDARVFCAGFNFAAPGRERPAFPTLFLRTRQSLVGHEQDIVRPSVSTSLDWEGEPAVIIGAPARHVGREQARAIIAGYTCLADNTVRDYAKHGSQATAGKNFDSSGAIGPAMTTRAAMPDLATVHVECRRNGEVVQHDSISQLLHSAEDLISYLSDVTTLLPGDVIALGTPAGIGARRDPPCFLAAGDVLEVAVTGVGILRNRVIDEKT